DRFREIDVNVVAGFFLRRWREDWFRQLVALPQAWWKFHAANCLRGLIFLPSRSREISARDAFDRHHLRLTHKHRPMRQRRGNLRQLRIRNQMILKLPAEFVEP